jgi:autotransporter-associated beta strand protein
MAAGPGNVSGGTPVNFILDANVTTLPSSIPSVIGANAIRLRGDQAHTSVSKPVTFDVPRGSAPVDLQIASSIQDLGAGFIKTGNGILSLTAPGSYSGPTVINGGTVVVKDSAAFGSSAVTIKSGSTLSLGQTGTLDGFGGFTLNGGPTLDASLSTATVTDTGSQARSLFSNYPLSVINGFVAKYTYTAGGDKAADGIAFVVQNNSPTALGTGGGGLGYTGILNSGALEFNLYTPNIVGANFNTNGATGGYTSTTPVNVASGNPIAVTVTYNPLALTLTASLVDPISGGSYSRTFNNVNFNTILGGGGTGYVGFTGGTGGASAIQKVGSFSFDSFSGGVSVANNISVDAGATVTLDIPSTSNGTPSTAGLAGTLSLNAGSTVNITGGSTVTNVPYTLASNGTIAIDGNVTVNVANNGAGLGTLIAIDISGQHAGATFTKTGPGTMILAGSGTYTGITTVNAGTLTLTGALTGAATVNSGGVLTGTGSTGGLVTVAGGGTLAPGTVGVGTFNAGSLLLQGGSTLALEIGATLGDQVKVAGTDTISGIIPLSLTLTTDPVDNAIFTILDGNSALVGYAGGARFSYLGTPLAQGAQFLVNDGGFSQTFAISYTAGGGQDVTLTAVPEPGSFAAILTGATALLGLRRRRTTETQA